MARSFTGKGRPGPLGRETRKALRSAPVASQGHVPILVEQAVAAADLADVARAEGDARLYLTASRELRQLLAMVAPGERGASGGAVLDDRADELADDVGAGPEMGHPPEL